MSRTLLIVDDIATNRRILRAALSKEYEIVEAGNGEEALDVLLRNYTDISAVLLDIQMPGIDGYEVLRRMRANAALSQVPVIMITGNEDEASRVKALALGASDFVMKPYNPEVIRHCLRNNIALRETSAVISELQRDKLTGLYNREAFFERVAEMVDSHEPGYYIMACFDISKFKVINDQYGTQRGDEVLRHVARVFEEGFATVGGLCCRMSADDFAVLYPTDFQDTAEIAEIRRRAGSVTGIVAPITFSIGRYVVDDTAMTPSAMFDRAMIAAESVKGKYDMQIAFYDESMRDRLLYEQEIVMEMEAALHAKQFEVWYQPQYNHETGALIGAEALVRWRHPEKGLIAPGVFIPVFEQNGFVYALDQYVWETVCSALRTWLDQGRSPLPVSVNVSRYDILRDDVADVIEGLVEKYHIPIELLRLEITESAFSESPKEIVQVVGELIAYGFTVEIDDFGSGYSSLNTLKDVPAQILKLDMRFLDSGVDSQRGGNILESVVRMAKWLGMSVIAEGVETIQQADYLRSIGCFYVQGFLYAHPMPVEEYEALCSGAGKEEHLLVLETVENLDNNAFWDPKSMDTLIFNSYVGGACIYEFHQGRVELLRATEKYAQVIGSAGMTVEDALKLDWADHMDEQGKAQLITDLAASVATRTEVTGEYLFLDLPGCPRETYLRTTMRVIASVGERYLVYCTNENITAQRAAEEREHRMAERLRIITDNMISGICATVFDKELKPTILFANERYYDILGYTREQAEAELNDISQVVHPEDVEIAKGMIPALFLDRVPRESDYRCIRRDGSVIFVHSSKSLAHFEDIEGDVVISIVTDITQTVLAEKRATRLADQMQAIMASVDLGICAAVTKGDEARFLFSNDRYYEMVGYTRAQFEAGAANPFGVIVPEDRQRVIAATERINHGHTAEALIYRVRRGDGEERWFRAAVSTGTFEGEESVVQLSILRDVTGEIEAEQRERRIAEQMQAIMDDIGSGVTATIQRDDAVEFLFSNDRFYAQHGYTREQYHAEVTDRYARIHPDDQERVRRVIVAACGVCAPVSVEYRFLCRDDTERWFRVDVSFSHFTGVEESVRLSIFTDITAEKKAERQIQETSAQLTHMMSDMPGGFARLQMDEDGRIRARYVNDGICKLTGMERDALMEMYGNDAFAGVHPDDVGVVNDMVTRMLQTGEARSSRYRLHCGGEDYVWLTAFGRVTKDADGCTYLNIYYMDASEQVREEEKQRELMDNIPGGAGLYLYESGRLSVVYLNKSYWAFVGREAKSYESLDIKSVVHPDDMQIALRELDSAIEQGREMACDLRLRHGSGGYRPVRLVGNIVPAGDGRYSIYTTFTPISEGEMSYQMMVPVVLSAIMESTSDLSFAKDKEFRYICASHAFTSMIGFERESDVIGKTDYDIFEKALADKYRKDDQALLDGGKSIIDMIEAIPSDDGVPHYSSTSKHLLRDSGGGVIGLYGVGRDVTVYRDAFDKLQLMTESIPGGLATYTCTPGDQEPDHIRITYFNDGFCRLFGLTREEYEAEHIRTGHPASMVYAEDYPMLVRQWLELVEHNTPINCLYRAHVKGGGYKWISHRAVAADRQEDRIVINANQQDETEQRDMIETLRLGEEENRLAILLGGNVICRYSVADRTLTMSPSVAASLSLPESVKNVPYEPVQLGAIAPESVDAYVAFFEAIQSGSASGTVVFRQRFEDDWRWLEGKSVTIYSDEGVPVKAVITFQDVTERQEKETVFRKWQQSLMDKASDSYTLFRCNLNENISYDTCEGTLLHFDFGGLACDFNGRAAEYAKQCVVEEDRTSYLALADSNALLAAYYRGKRTGMLEYREMLPNGGTRWIRLTVELVGYPNSKDVAAYMMYEDIDEAKQGELRVQALAAQDPLTGVLQRAAFSERVTDSIAAAELGALSALLMLDIDGFKRVNDAFGHGVGDRVLMDLARSVCSVTRKDDLVGRIGGDEFLVFLRDIPDDTAAAKTAERICALTRISLSAEVQISCSVGIVLVPRDGTAFDALYKKADAAMYHAKGLGKDRYAFYSDDMADEHLTPQAEHLGAINGHEQEPRRRMLIVDDDAIDHELLAHIFEKEFLIEKAKDGETALIRLHHYGSAISVVLLDLMMPGMDGFTVLERMRADAATAGIPVVIVSGDESRETCLRTIRSGATDFVTKPVDPELLRLRVRSAVSKAENERLRAANRFLQLQNDDRQRYEEALEGAGVTSIDYDWANDVFTYYPSIQSCLAGKYDERGLWHVLLSDMVADTQTVHAMQRLVHDVSTDRERMSGSMTVRLKTPQRLTHSFRMSVRKPSGEQRLMHMLTITLVDLEYDAAEQ